MIPWKNSAGEVTASATSTGENLEIERFAEAPGLVTVLVIVSFLKTDLRIFVTSKQEPNQFMLKRNKIVTNVFQLDFLQHLRQN